MPLEVLCLILKIWVKEKLHASLTTAHYRTTQKLFAEFSTSFQPLKLANYQGSAFRYLLYHIYSLTLIYFLCFTYTPYMFMILKLILPVLSSSLKSRHVYLNLSPIYTLVFNIGILYFLWPKLNNSFFLLLITASFCSSNSVNGTIFHQVGYDENPAVILDSLLYSLH